MKITPATPDIALPIAAFLRRHYPACRHWPREVLLAWTRWNLGEGFVGHVVDGERIVGVGVARPVMRPEDGLDDYRFDPEGPYLFVDAAATTRPRAAACLVGLMRRRFGFRPRLAYQRRGESRVRVLNFMRVHARLFPAVTT